MSSNRTSIILIGAGLLAAALSGCASQVTPETAAATPKLPTEQYPLEARSHPDEIRLAAHAQGLSLEQRAALESLAGRWREDGGGLLTIRVPTRGVDSQAAYLTAMRSRAFLTALGLPPDRLREASYEPTEAAGPAPIVVSYAAYEPVIPQCGNEWESLTRTGQNQPTKNFGCAVTANMAAQIANPADIDGPRALDPADAGRRSVVIDKYRQGDVTSGAKDAQAAGAVSKAAGGGSGG